jgi:hypothetical protein
MDEREALQQLNIDELSGTSLDLQAKVKQLEGRHKRPPKTSENSSVPLGQHTKANRPKKKSAKRRSKEDHSGISRTKAKPDMVVDLRTEQCTGCGADLHRVEQSVIGSGQAADGLSARPVVNEAQRCETLTRYVTRNQRRAIQQCWKPSGWLIRVRVVQTDESAYYTIALARGAVVPDRLMGDTLPTVWDSDLAKVEIKQSSVLRQFCLAHQIRDLQYAIDLHRCAWTYCFRAQLSRAMCLDHRCSRIPPYAYGQQVIAIEHACDALLEQPPCSYESQKLSQRFLLHCHHLFTFLVLPSALATNNASEQALCNSAIYRKVTDGFRSQWGTSAYVDVASVLEIAGRHGQDFLDNLLPLFTKPFDLSLSFASPGE